MPHACQQFPRVATLSPLGTSVTLSAFCPTAASMLFDDAPFEIVSIEDTRKYEGLDATNVLPPLLREGMLMDWDGVAAWEQLAVATFSAHRHDVDRALRIIEDASEAACATWSPDDGPLRRALAGAFADAGMSGVTPLKGRRRDRSLARPQPGGTTDIPASAASARYFASHAFACWDMYRGAGIRGAIDALVKARTALDEERRSCADLKEAFRRADLALRHRV